MTNAMNDYVATGNVKAGEWMLRYIAEAEGIEYREVTEEEADEIDCQLGV